jgi:hypothetical protein
MVALQTVRGKTMSDKHTNLTFLFPTRIIGTFGQKCFTSGVHFSGIFSNESGESMEKHISMTSVSG